LLFVEQFDKLKLKFCIVIGLDSAHKNGLTNAGVVNVCYAGRYRAELHAAKVERSAAFTWPFNRHAVMIKAAIIVANGFW